MVDSSPPCQHPDGCHGTGFSQSVEHDNLWICAKHYDAFKKQKANLAKATKALSEIISDEKKFKKLMEMLG